MKKPIPSSLGLSTFVLLGLISIGVSANAADRSVTITYGDNQIMRLVAAFDEVSQKEGQTGAWKELAEHCPQDRGELHAIVAQTEKDAGIFFTCKAEGQTWRTPWYLNKLGSSFSIERYAGDVALFDDSFGKSNTLVYHSFFSDGGTAYDDSYQLLQGDFDSIVMPEAITAALRRWISRQSSRDDLDRNGQGALSGARQTHPQ